MVGLADQAEACLKVWEGLLFPNNKKVGSLANGGYSNGESGTTRLVRTVCKSVQELGGEKSGRMVHFGKKTITLKRFHCTLSWGTDLIFFV